MNKTILIGRIVRDPDVRYSNNGNKQMAVARYTLAVDRPFSKHDGQQNADFISCVAFDKNAEIAEKYFKKGTKIAVCGHLQSGSYTNKDGVRQYTTDVIIESQEFAESKNQANNGSNSSHGTNYQGNARNCQNGANTVSDDGFMNIPDGVEDEALPFN